ncbi:MAG TPA: TonB-dependent receptor, partial [Verrucomicrobiae bacterium]|nr:TonB-dependent receptor [Verrucomicrobiae bacterium]
MKASTAGLRNGWVGLMGIGLVLTADWLCAAEQGQYGPNAVRIVAIIGPGPVEVLPPGGNAWILTLTNQILQPGFHLRTGPNNRAVVRWSDQSVVTFGPLTEVEILPSPDLRGDSAIHLWRGLLSFFHRGRPGRIRILNQGTTAGVKGTEFVVDATATGPEAETFYYVLDGRIELTNSAGTLALTNGQHASVAANQGPLLQTAGFIAKNVLQWCLYYPAVLDLRDLPFTAAERGELETSLNSYRAGDLSGALAAYPGRPPGSVNDRLYHAALLLAVGRVDGAADELLAIEQTGLVDRQARLQSALRLLIAAARADRVDPGVAPETGTELLARSYYEQSRAAGDESLGAALQWAETAVAQSPDFGFAWVRLAELEFSFGHIDRAFTALERGLSLAPKHGEGLALRGFLRATQNRMRDSKDSFQQAIAQDPALANGWLGRGLVRFRQGDVEGGREDMLIAAAVEPNRAILRSYLAKAWAVSRERNLAAHELELAQALDPSDPTAWLYSALLNQQNNRINEGIRDLEESQRLNDNRRVYRSRLLLDQDQAARSVSLANLYRDAGMSDVSVREAAAAVSSDYANYSAHLFLADSYNLLRDPNRVNLRYETPSVSEYLIANLLAPVAAGPLSPVISQQDYGGLMERNRLGIVSSTEYLSRGAWTETASQFGVFDNASYAVEGGYRSDPGQRPNNDLEEYSIAVQLKVQLTAQDSLYFRVNRYESETGDLQQYYDQDNAIRGFHMEELQNPIALAGYHREWKPGLHTLLLGTRLDSRITVTNPLHRTLMVSRAPEGLDFAEPMTVEQKYRSELEIYTAEAQQIWQRTTFSTVLGLLYQGGEIETTNRDVNASPNVVDLFPPTGSSQAATTDFERFSAYGYHHQRLLDSLLLVGGVSYDWVRYPDNFRSAPISSGTETRDQLSPKAGLVWTPVAGTVVRGAFSRSLGGASIDQSFRLEPTQVAGVNQSFRSILPEAVGGTQAGARFEVAGVSLEHRLPTRTYLGISGEHLESEIDRTTGVYVVDFAAFSDPGGTREETRYREWALVATVDQLIGDEWSTGVRYRLSDADLEDQFDEIVPGAGTTVPPQQEVSATLHQVEIHAFYTAPSGWFAQAYALWNHQENQGYPEELGDDFWQFNVLAGYRLAQR